MMDTLSVFIGASAMLNISLVFAWASAAARAADSYRSQLDTLSELVESLREMRRDGAQLKEWQAGTVQVLYAGENDD